MLMRQIFSYRILFVLVLLAATAACQPSTKPQAPYEPQKDLPTLYAAVQQSALYKDSKTFADALPTRNPSDIEADFDKQKNEPNFSLQAFVNQHFTLPQRPQINSGTQAPNANLAAHLKGLWPTLHQPADSSLPAYSSRLPLPYPYTVPGGRFTEMYYWDSYFTLAGLMASQEHDQVRHMLNNFKHLINTYGYVPNGTRSYYLGRSQPPFFASMVLMFGQRYGMSLALPFTATVEKEYSWWMRGQDQLSQKGQALNRVVMLDSGLVLNRYFSNNNGPRTESYREDMALAANLTQAQKEDLWLNIRATCESGWDFSTRFMATPGQLSSLNTTQLIPVDLNCLLYQYESLLALLYSLQKNTIASQSFAQRAMNRRKALMRYCYNAEKQWFFDYNYVQGQQTPAYTLAATYALFFGLVSQEQAVYMGQKLKDDFLMPGGLVTTVYPAQKAPGPAQQWDHPNGWPPLQYMAIKGLERYYMQDLANNIKARWLGFNQRVYKRTGRMVEKYNVVDTTLQAGGGEYPTQDGFGWTNGVWLSLNEGL